MSWFDHFILTRFNVRVPGWARQTDDDWLRNRISLFERYCVTSVANKTSKEFRWLVFFDVSTQTHRANLAGQQSWELRGEQARALLFSREHVTAFPAGS